jgi:hypothetical protein
LIKGDIAHGKAGFCESRSGTVILDCLRPSPEHGSVGTQQKINRFSPWLADSSAAAEFRIAVG